MDEKNEIDDLFGRKIEIENSLSYSRLSDFDRNGPKVLIKRSDPQGYGLTIGTIVDDLTLPVGDYVFSDNYIISDIEKPTATLGKLVDIILKNYNELPSKEEILKICKNNDFWKRSKDETITANFDSDDFWGYLKVFIQATTKNIITTQEEQKSKTISETLLTHRYSRHIFENKLQNINRFKLDFKYRGIRFKGELDKLIIDHENKTIQEIDIKTGQDESLKFMKSFLKYRYYLQEAVYTKGYESICEQLGLVGYTLLPFQFLYIGRSELVPLIYTVTDKWHNAAQNGFYINDYEYKGLDELIDDVKWHFENREFEVPKRISESNGIINLNDNFINLK